MVPPNWPWSLSRDSESSLVEPNRSPPASNSTVFGSSDDPDVVARLHAAGYPRAVVA